MLLQEAIETLDPGKVFDMELDGKLHMLYGGTKVVQHSPPSKTGPGLKGTAQSQTHLVMTVNRALQWCKQNIF